MLAPVEPLDVEIGEFEVLLPAGIISSMLEGTIVVQVSMIENCPHGCMSSLSS